MGGFLTSRTGHVWFCITIMALALFFAQTAHAAVQEVANGTVTKTGGTPVQGATVECHLANGSVTSSDITDANGDYNCSLDTATFTLNSTIIVVEVRAMEGYRTPGGNNLTWNGSSQEANFELTPTAKTIDFTVRDTDGNLVAADVTAQPIDIEPGQNASQASENGSQGALDVTGGKWIVFADCNLSEQNPETCPWVAISAAQQVEFADDDTEETAEVEFTVARTDEKVSVTMVDADGNILTQNDFNGDLTFVGYNKDYGSVTTRRKINASTGGVIIYLLPGVWRVAAIHPQLNGQSYDPAETTFVLPDDGETLALGTIQAAENQGTIAGSVSILNSDGQSKVNLIATNLDTGTITNAQTLNDGSFSIGNLGYGAYSITVSDNQYTPVQTGSANITADNKAVTGVALEIMANDSTVKGSVTDSDGDALTNFAGNVVVRGDEVEFTAPVEPDGSFELELYTKGLSGDSMTLELIPAPGAEAFASDTVEVPIVKNSTFEADIETSTNEATISGNMTDFDNDELTSAKLGEGAEVMALNVETGAVEKATVADDGSFSMEVGPGTWTIVPQIEDVDADVVASGVSGTSVTVNAGDEETVNVPVQESDATVTGTITDPSGDAVPEAPVLLTNLPALQAEAEQSGDSVDERMIVSVVVSTDADGAFSKELPAGEYTAVFGNNPDQTGNTEPTQETITATAGDTTDVSAEFRDANATLAGDMGQNFDTGTVTAYAADGGTQTVEMEKDGSYSMDLAPGEWSVIASGVKEGEVYVDQQTVTVESGDNTLDPELEATGVDFPSAVTVTGSADEPMVLSNTDGASVSIPAYSAGFDGEVTATLQPLLDFGNSGDISQVSLSYEITVQDEDGVPIKKLNRDATVTLPIDEEFSQGVDDSEMTAAYYNPDLESFLYDGLTAKTDGAEMVIQTSHLSRFAATTSGDVTVGAVSKPGVVKTKSLKVKKLKQRSATASWKAVSGATSYKLLLQKKNGSAFKKVKLFTTISGVQKQLGKKFLLADTQYRFKVRACNSAGCGKFSGFKKFKTK